MVYEGKSKPDLGAGVVYLRYKKDFGHQRCSQCYTAHNLQFFMEANKHISGLYYKHILTIVSDDRK
jgi:hypothetical protein